MKNLISKLRREGKLTLVDCGELIGKVALAMRNMNMALRGDIHRIVPTFSVTAADLKDSHGTAIPLSGVIQISQHDLRCEKDTVIAATLRHEIAHVLDGVISDSIAHREKGGGYEDNPREIRARRVGKYKKFPKRQNVAW